MKEEGAISVDEAKQLICELCANFYGQGWVSGTGGGISMQAAGGTIVMAPSGVQKERMEPRDMFVLDAAGNVLHTPEARPPPYKPPKLSECAPLFTAVRGSREAVGGGGGGGVSQRARHHTRAAHPSCCRPARTCVAARAR
jgi:methylthioribulose 1-phosphate dehydratase/enolase-phosphatase E1